ncbi:MAG: DUF1385 domain-containing protein, partial [Nanoarchaeota archaeon]
GQAVMEGVMMRKKEKFSVAVRKKNGKIKIKNKKSSQFPKFFNFFFLRGIVGLWYTLSDGIKALVWSSNQNLEKEEKLSTKEIAGTLAFSLLIAVVVFVGLPFFLAGLIHSDGFWFNLLDGIIRVIFFIGYLLLISRIGEVKQIFRYHGAEHKVIACYEAKEELTVKNAKKYSRFHPRCGTSFLFIVLLLSVILFSLLDGAWYVKLLGRLALIPVIAGLGYELIKLSAKYHHNFLIKILITPGLWLQRLTTNEPNAKQIEVGIAALKRVVK